MQLIGVERTLLATNKSGSLTVILVVAVQPLVSVTYTYCVPAETGEVSVPPEGAVPPVAETVTVAVPPLQLIGVERTLLATNKSGSLTVILVVAVQPLVSVSVTYLVLAENREVSVSA